MTTFWEFQNELRVEARGIYCEPAGPEPRASIRRRVYKVTLRERRRLRDERREAEARQLLLAAEAENAARLASAWRALRSRAAMVQYLRDGGGHWWFSREEGQCTRDDVLHKERVHLWNEWFRHLPFASKESMQELRALVSAGRWEDEEKSE